MEEGKIWDQLIELVRDQPVLYDPTHKHYSDKAMKIKTWTAIGNQLGLEPRKCRYKWNSLRDNYRKMFKKNQMRIAMGQPINYSKYSDTLDFIAKYFKVQEFSVSGEDSEEQPPEEDECADEKSNDEVEFVYTPRKSEKTDQTFEGQYSNESFLSVVSTSARTHPVDMFLASISPTLKSLSPIDLSMAKAEIFRTVHKYDLKALSATKEPRDHKSEPKRARPSYSQTKFQDPLSESEQSDA